MSENFEAMNDARDGMDEGQRQQVHVDFHTRLVARFEREIYKVHPEWLVEDIRAWAEELAQASNDEAQKFAASFIKKGKNQ